MKLPTGLVLAALVGLVSAAHAQQDDQGRPEINPYRPTVTDPASLTAPGYLEVEIGGQDQHGSEDAHRQFSTPTVLKLTDKSERLEYHVLVDGYVTQTDDHGQSTSGFGDLTPGVQYLLVKQSPHTYDVAARLECKIPSAKAGIGTGKTDYDLLLLASKDYSQTVHGDYNLGVYQLGKASGQGFATQYQASAAFTFKLSDKLNLQDELYAFSGNSENGTLVSTLHALGYRASPDLAFDLGVDIGLSHAAPRYTVLFGTTFFFGKLF